MGEDDLSLYEGEDSKHMLGSVFTMWLRDRGDISDWDNAPLLGGIVHTYSDLSLPVIGVWLGIEPSEIWDVDVPASSPPWKFEGPTGETLTIKREIK
jgi:hypothetical protein